MDAAIITEKQSKLDGTRAIDTDLAVCARGRVGVTTVAVVAAAAARHVERLVELNMED